MNIYSTTSELQRYVRKETKSQSIGFVPTMGYLHDGHVQLIKEAKKQCDKVIVSIYVNPTQFGPNEDFDNYPRDNERDIKVCKDNNVDALFFPTDNEIYAGEKNELIISFPELSKKLCGIYRTNHFDGVTTVMSKLLNIVKPDKCFMGKKDGQQLILIKKMAADLFIDCEVVGVSTVREQSGLAMSSRNVYLVDQQKQKAININKVIDDLACKIENDYFNFKIDQELEIAKEYLTHENLEVQYVEIVERKCLERPDHLSFGEFMICVAAKCGTTRLIDNYFIDINENGVAVDRGIKLGVDSYV